MRFGGSRIGCIVVAMATFIVLGGCELTETLAVDETEVILVTSYVVVTQPNGDGEDASMVASASLSRSNVTPIWGPDAPDDPVVRNAQVAIVAADGREVRLWETDHFRCQADTVGGSACYVAPADVEPFAPGEQIALQVTLADGTSLYGDSRIPGAFAFLDAGTNQGRCRVEPMSNHRLSWTPSEDSWAYLSETNIRDLDQALADRDFEVPDSVYLFGLSIGEEDTDIVYPRDLAGFSTFDDETEYPFDLLLTLQEGLPDGIEAAMSVAAVDRNWVNWVRGGNFTTSGEYKIPSVFGDGTGLFGTATNRVVGVSATADVAEAPPCGPMEP